MTEPYTPPKQLSKRVKIAVMVIAVVFTIVMSMILLYTTNSEMRLVMKATLGIDPIKEELLASDLYDKYSQMTLGMTQDEVGLIMGHYNTINEGRMNSWRLAYGELKVTFQNDKMTQKQMVFYEYPETQVDEDWLNSLNSDNTYNQITDKLGQVIETRCEFNDEGQTLSTYIWHTHTLDNLAMGQSQVLVEMDFINNHFVNWRTTPIDSE